MLSSQTFKIYLVCVKSLFPKLSGGGRGRTEYEENSNSHNTVITRNAFLKDPFVTFFYTVTKQQRKNTDFS